MSDYVSPEEHDKMCREHYAKLKRHRLDLPRAVGDELSKLEIGMIYKGGLIMAIDQEKAEVWTTK